MSTIPEPWESALLTAGLTDPRNAERASWSALGRKISVHTSTLSAMANGTRETASETIEKVAEALRVDVRTVSEWVGRARSERAPFRPHEDADLLDSEERETINRVIALLAKSKKRGQHDGRQPDAEKTPLMAQGDTTLAAHHAPSRGKLADKAYGDLGEESQDTGEVGPA